MVEMEGVRKFRFGGQIRTFVLTAGAKLSEGDAILWDNVDEGLLAERREPVVVEVVEVKEMSGYVYITAEYYPGGKMEPVFFTPQPRNKPSFWMEIPSTVAAVV